MAGSSGYGTILKREGTAIAELTSIGELSCKADTIDVTTHDSDYAHREYVAGLIEVDDLSIEGFFLPGDSTGQVALLSDLRAREPVNFEIVFPESMASSCEFAAIVTGFTLGPAEVDEAVKFAAELKPVGRPTLNITYSAGLTTPYFVLEDQDNISVSPTPSASGSVYEYVATFDGADTGLYVTPTATTGTITITSPAGSQVVSGGNKSSLIALGSAGSIIQVTIRVQETGKIARVYTIRCVRP